MAKSKVYDIRIEIEDDRLNIRAYKLKVNADNVLSSDEAVDQVGKTFSRSLKDKRNSSLIGYVLDLDEWNMRGDWNGYKELQYSDYILVGDTPKPLLDWYESLPEYEVKLDSPEL